MYVCIWNTALKNHCRSSSSTFSPLCPSRWSSHICWGECEMEIWQTWQHTQNSTFRYGNTTGYFMCSHYISAGKHNLFPEYGRESLSVFAAGDFSPFFPAPHSWRMLRACLKLILQWRPLKILLFILATISMYCSSLLNELWVNEQANISI